MTQAHLFALFPRANLSAKEREAHEKIARLGQANPRCFTEAFALWPASALSPAQASYRAQAANALCAARGPLSLGDAGPEKALLLLRSAAVWAAVAQAPSGQLQKFERRVAPWARSLLDRASGQGDPLARAQACVDWAKGLSGAAKAMAERPLGDLSAASLGLFQALSAECGREGDRAFGELGARCFGGAETEPGAGARAALREAFLNALSTAAIHCVCPAFLVPQGQPDVEEKLKNSDSRAEIVAQWRQMPDPQTRLRAWAKTIETARGHSLPAADLSKLALEVALPAAGAWRKLRQPEQAGGARAGEAWDDFLCRLCPAFFDAFGRSSLSAQWAFAMAIDAAQGGLGAPAFFARARAEWEPDALRRGETGLVARLRAASEAAELKAASGFSARQSGEPGAARRL